MIGDKSGAAHAVCYEMLQFHNCMRYQSKFCVGGNEPSLARLLLEAFLLHYRTLRDFLKNQRHDEDDVVARDFSRRWRVATWPDHVKDPRARTDERYSERVLINKLLAHITYFREETHSESPGGISWPVVEMYATVRNRFLEFVDSLPAEEQKLFSECAIRLRSPGDHLPRNGVSNSTETRGPAYVLPTQLNGRTNRSPE